MTPHPVRAVGIVGGTGPMGRGLAVRLAGAGVGLLLGSRDPERARTAAAHLRQLLGGSRAVEILGGGNLEAAGHGQLTLLTIPYEADSPSLQALAPHLRDRVTVSTAAPMEFRAGIPHPLHPPAGSAAQELAQLCPEALVVGAFHTVSASLLGRMEAVLAEDVIVTSDHSQAKDLVLALVGMLDGLRGVDGGRLANSAFTEGLTPFLLRLNRLHRAATGVRVTGLAQV
ncbi:MAG: NADPH-dependent F420 reductase [Candidatus Dormibacteria bacterium]